jgi:23S rRNA (guanosine2251-2'-O)-methyltransferase
MKNRYENRRNDRRFEESTPDENLVIGRNAVRELLKSSRSVDKIFVSKGEREGSITMLVAKAIELGIPVVECEKQKLDQLAAGVVHQGIIAMAAAKEYVSVEEMATVVKILHNLIASFAAEPPAKP